MSLPSVKIAVTRMQTTIPQAGISKMYKKKLNYKTPLMFVIEFPPITRAAHVD